MIYRIVASIASLFVTSSKPEHPRSPKWPALEKEWLHEHPECAVCGRKDKLQAHHVEPVHVNPARELDKENLLTLCNPGEGGCHLRFGHLWLWSSWNSRVRTDAALWRAKVASRPLLRTALLVFGILLLSLSWSIRVEGQQSRPQQRPDPTWAVCRISSHGCSATIIETGKDRTLLLGCAHAFEGADRTRRIAVDAPAPTAGPAKAPGVRLVAIDYQLDLTLVEISAGPLPYSCPVAPAGHRIAGRVLSVGYDEMRGTADGKPSVIRYATILGVDGKMTYTKEQPWHGRSGGALIDEQAGLLIGVVHGYECDVRGHFRPGVDRGKYVSHQAILAFLAQPVRPAPLPVRGVEFELRIGQPRPDCPDGRCPVQR